jgi:hypothetical protein
LTQRPVKMKGNTPVTLQVNDTLTHPLAGLESGSGREKLRYKFLRITRPPIEGRPDSGRILVENVASGIRKEFYALLFGVTFRAEK